VFPGETTPPPAETDVNDRADAAATANGVTAIDAAGSHQVTGAVA